MKKDQKIIMFPKLKERLLDKGMAALEKKDYHSAYELLSKARELDKELEEVDVAIILCLLELKQLEKAKEEAKRLLFEGKGDYFQILQIYITILLQEGNYDEIVTLIEATLEDPTVPYDQREQLEALLSISQKNLQNEIQTDNNAQDYDYLSKEFQRLIESFKEPHIQLSILAGFQGIPLEHYLSEIQTILLNDEQHPVIKTVLLKLCMENNLRATLLVRKFEEQIEIDVSSLHDLGEEPFVLEVMDHLRKQLEDENPSLYRQLEEVWARHLFVLFPFLPEPRDSAAWAASLEQVGYEWLGINEWVLDRYGVDEDLFLSISHKINELEKISSLQL